MTHQKSLNSFDYACQCRRGVRTVLKRHALEDTYEIEDESKMGFNIIGIC